jgi:hypothetical protein
MKTMLLLTILPCNLLGYHGDNGPIAVSEVRGTSLSEAFLVASTELGYTTTDVNGQRQHGYYLCSVLC